MRIISVRQEPAFKDIAIAYFQSKWASEDSMMLYQDAITRCIGAENPLPQWFLLMEGDEI
ncbi:hypothetical protein D3C73_1487790 [compost metagenome]